MKRQKHKGKKRPRSWHRRGRGPDWAFMRAMKRLEGAGLTILITPSEPEKEPQP